MDSRPLVEQVVRFAFLIRLASLLLVLLMPSDALRSPFLLASVAFITLTSGLGLYRTAAFTRSVSTHPLLLVADVLVAGAVAATLGSQSPIVLYSLSTAVLVGILLRPRVAGLVLAILTSSYVLVALLEEPPVGGMATLLIPLACLTVGALGSLTRTLHESAMVEQAKARRSSEDAARDRERARLARAMHDSVAKSLHGIGLAAAALPAWAQQRPESVAEKARELQDAAEAASRDARSILVELRAETDDRTLPQQLRAMIDDLAGGGMATGLEVEGVGDCDHQIKRELVGIAAEAIENVRRHSNASTVEMTCRGDDDAITLELRDDGDGFDPGQTPTGRFGVVGMRERAAVIGGELALASEHGAGTTILVRVPRFRIGTDPGRMSP